MKRLVAVVVVVVLALGVGLALVARGGADDTKAPAQSLPAATLQPLRAGGDAVDTRELRGPMVVNLWAQWCGPCRDELPKYEAFHQAHPQVKVLGVDWADPQRDRALALADRTGLSYPLVRDPDRLLGGRRGLPQLLLVDAKGRVAYSAYVEITSVSQLESLVREHLGVDL